MLGVADYTPVLALTARPRETSLLVRFSTLGAPVLG
jgi:hypothetical protein